MPAQCGLHIGYVIHAEPICEKAQPPLTAGLKKNFFSVRFDNFVLFFCFFFTVTFAHRLKSHNFGFQPMFLYRRSAGYKFLLVLPSVCVVPLTTYVSCPTSPNNFRTPAKVLYPGFKGKPDHVLYGCQWKKLFEAGERTPVDSSY